MKYHLAGLTALALLAACGKSTEQAPTEQAPAAEAEVASEATPPAEPACEPEQPTLETVEITTGLTSVTTAHGCGRGAEPGDLTEVHYTGWLFDAEAEENRGEKFDSSLDRGQPFRFPLGAGRVIKGWDQGVVGMQVGETRILTIAPDMAYGDRDRGPIPANSTLIFEVELLGLTAPGQ